MQVECCVQQCSDGTDKAANSYENLVAASLSFAGKDAFPFQATIDRR